MRRDLDPALSADVAAPVVRPFLWLSIDLPDPVYAWTGRGILNFRGAEWTGIEGVASIDTIGETTDGSATGVKSVLARVPAEFREDIADQAVRGCAMELGVGTLDETFQVVRAVKRLWKGSLQDYEVVDSGTELTVTVTGENRSIDQRRPAIKRYTDEWQQRKFAGDRFFEFVPQMVTVPILWARKTQDSVVTGGSSGAGGGFLNAMIRNA